MVAAVRVHKTGGPEVLTYEDVEVPAPGPGPDHASRTTPAASTSSTPISASGMYPAPVGLPFVVRQRGSGRGDRGRARRDRYQGRRPRRLYVGARRLCGGAAPAGRPRGEAARTAISYEQAAAMMLKGMTAQYLLRRTFKVQKGDNVLIHAAAGGVGLIACQWANHLGANVIGTVGSKEKAELAKANGCAPRDPLSRRGFRRARSRRSPAASCARWSMTASARRRSRPRSTASSRSACS